MAVFRERDKVLKRIENCTGHARRAFRASLLDDVVVSYFEKVVRYSGMGFVAAHVRRAVRERICSSARARKSSPVTGSALPFLRSS